MMLERKRISSKINYDVLRHLNSKGAAGGRGGGPGGAPSDPGAAAGRKRLGGRRRSSCGASGELSSRTAGIGKR